MFVKRILWGLAPLMLAGCGYAIAPDIEKEELLEEGLLKPPHINDIPKVKRKKEDQ